MRKEGEYHNGNRLWKTLKMWISWDSCLKLRLGDGQRGDGGGLSAKDGWTE